MSDEFDAAVAATLQPDPAQSARVGFSAAADTNPDAYAEAQRVARRTGVPVDTAFNMPKEMQRQDAIGSMNFDSLAQTSPVTAALLADVDKAKLAHDDVDNLSGMEQTLKFGKNIGKSLGAAYFGFGESAAGLMQGGVDALNSMGATPGIVGSALSTGLNDIRQNQMQWREYLTPQTDNPIEAGVYSGVQSLGQFALTAPIALGSGHPELLLPMMAAETGGQSYGKAIDKGLAPWAATTYASGDAAIEYATEFTGVNRLLGDLKIGSPLFKTLAHQFLPDMVGEQAATVLQDFNEWAVLHPEQTLKDYTDARPDAAIQTAVASAIGGAGQVTLAKLIDRAVGDSDQKQQAAQQAEQDAQLLGQLNELAKASRVLGRDKQTANDFILQATENGPVQHVYIDANTLMQSGKAEQLAAVSPAVAEQLPTQAAIGGQIAIPIEDYTTNIAPTEYAQELNDHFKVDPQGYSRAEATEYMDNHASELQQEVERVLGEKQADDAFKQSADNVREHIKEQLDTAGRFTPQVNDSYSALVGNFFAVTAAKIGITPEQLYERYPLQVVAESIGGHQYDQILADAMPNNMEQGDGQKAAAMYRGEDKTGAILLGQAEPRLITEAAQSGHSYGAYSHSVDVSALNHIRNRHGDNATERKRGQLPVRDIDIAAIPDIVSNYDAVRFDLVNDLGRPMVAYAKQTPDGAILYFEEVRKKRRDLAAHAMRRYPATSDAADILHNVPLYARNDGGHNQSVDQNNNEYNQAARGGFNPDTLTLSLLKNADLSTFLHESGHFFLEVEFDLAERLSQQESLTPGELEIVKDTNALLAWFGVPDIQTWHNMDIEEKRSFHEQFARGFESYLFEGKAPSIELQGFFQRFRGWLLNIYKSLKALNVELTDDVRGVFDRMLASNEQITLAEQARSMMPLFQTAEQAGMTPEEWYDYQSQGTSGTADAIQDYQAKGLRDLQWLDNARDKLIKKLQKQHDEIRRDVRSAVRTEVLSEPVYQAWSLLTRKTDGVKLDAESVNALGLPDMVTKRLRDYSMIRVEGGLPADAVAELIVDKDGRPLFSSGDQMIRELAAADNPKDAIEALTDARMLEQHGELATPEAIKREADKAIHNDARAKFTATEVNALAKATGQRRILVSAAKEFANIMIARKKVRELRAGQYAAAEVKASKNAAAAMKKGDLAVAAAEKRNQLINQYAAKAVYEAQDDVDNIARFFRKVVSGKDEDVSKTRDMDIVNAARAVLANFGYGGKAKTAVEYLKSVEANDPGLYAVLSQSVKAAEALAASTTFRKLPSIHDLSVENLRALHDEVQALWYLAKRNRQMEIDGNLMDREDIAEKLVERMGEIGVPETAPGDNSAITPEEERALHIASAKAIGRRVESWVDLKDGSNKMGAFRRYIWTPIKEAADAYRADKATHLRAFRAAFDTVAPTFKAGLIHSPQLNYTFGKGSGGVAMNEILHAILHTGNESNKRKLLLGRGWATDRPDGSLDTSRWDAFIGTLIRDGRLQQAHFDFAQSVWDLLESMKPLAQKAHRDAYGRYFAEITADPVVTPFGTYRGGYVPATVDTSIVKDGELKKMLEEGKEGMAYAFPGTSKGFTKSRVEYNRPLILDLRTLAQHIDKVLLFSHLEIPVRDASKLLGAKAVSGPLNKIDPAAINSMLIPWLNRTAHQQVSIPVTGAPGIAQLLNAARNRTSMAAMFANVSNTAQQITGFSLAALKVKPSNLMAATADYLKAPKQTAQEVAELSTYMAHRMSNEIEAMLGDINAILLNPSVYEKAQEWTKQHTFFMQSAVDNVMGPIIWKAAFNEALEDNFDVKDAVRIADATVRQTQGSSLPEDVSRIETGPAYARIMTLFAGYFNMQANLLGTEFAKVAREMGVRKGMGKGFMVFVLGLYAPALVAEAIAQAFRGGPGDDDKDGEYLDDWLMALLVWGPMRNMTAMVPFAGQIANSAMARANDNPTDDRMSFPVVGALEAAAWAPVDVYKAVTGNGNAQRTVKDVATLISLTTGLPANIAARPVSYAAGIMQDKIDPTGAADALRGLITGTASPESRQP